MKENLIFVSTPARNEKEFVFIHQLPIKPVTLHSENQSINCEFKQSSNFYELKAFKLVENTLYVNVKLPCHSYASSLGNKCPQLQTQLQLEHTNCEHLLLYCKFFVTTECKLFLLTTAFSVCTLKM